MNVGFLKEKKEKNMHGDPMISLHTMIADIGPIYVKILNNFQF